MTKQMTGVAAIEWTDRTWNPVAGCSYHHEGCRNCYAVPMSLRQEGMNNGGPTLGGKMKNTRPQYAGLVDRKRVLPDGSVATHFNGTIRRAGDNQFFLPLAVRKPTTWFVNSMSDVFHENMRDDWLTSIWGTMVACPHHNFQVLTKRPNRARRKIAALGLEMAPNIWLGASICENKFAKVMVRDLAACGAAVTFVSAEPLLEALPDLDVTAIDWLIAGGESGRGQLRPTDVDWVRDLRDRCADAGTPFFFKQWGHAVSFDGGKRKVLSKADAGHLIDGEEIWQMPSTVFDRMTISNPRWTRIHKSSVARLRAASAAPLPHQRNLMAKGKIVIIDPIDEDTYERERDTIVFTDDDDTATIQRLAAPDGVEMVFDNPNVDANIAADKVERVFRAIGDTPSSVATIVRETNLSHPTVARIARKLAREGRVFEVRHAFDPALGAAQPSFAFSRRTQAEAEAARAEQMLAEAEAMMAKAREMLKGWAP